MSFVPLWLACFFLLFTFALRVIALPDKAVWWDEAWSIWVAQQPFDQTTDLTARDVHPPLYQWALHLWVRAAGISEFSARYLSAIWGTLACALVYTLARRLGDARAGLIALGFAALSVLLIHWAQETRMYAQVGFFTILTTYAYTRTWGKMNHKGAKRTKEKTSLCPLWLCGSNHFWWIVMILAGAATALTHYLGAFVLVILNLHWLLTLRVRERTYHVRWIGAMLATGAIILLWVVYAVGRTRSGSVESGFDPALVFQLMGALYTVGTSLNLEAYTLVGAVAAAVFFIGLGLYARQDKPRQHAALLIIMMALLPPLAIYLLSVLQTRFYAPRPEERYIVIFAPVVYAGVGLALAALYRWRRIVGAAAIIGLAALYIPAYMRDLDARYLRDDYATLVRTVDFLATPDEPIFFVSDDRYPLVRYHLNRAANLRTGAWQTPLNAGGILDPANAVENGTLEAAVGDVERFWFVQIESHLQDPDNRVIQWLDGRFQRIFHHAFAHNSLTLYARDADSTPPDTDVILPPPISEARPSDVVRIGTDQRVDVLLGDQLVYSFAAPTHWQISEFTVFPAYPPGAYALQTGTARYAFQVTHSQPTPNDPPRNLDADFGALRLLGYTLADDSVRPGETFEITLYWQVEAAPDDANYTVFAHLLGPFTETGPVWANDDSYPAQTPTSALWPGLTFSDTRRLHVPETMPQGTYDAEFGLYHQPTGQRLTLPDGTDHVLISGLQVNSLPTN